MEELTGWSHETELAADPLSASRARDFVTTHLVNHGLAEIVEDVRLVTSELTTNAMRHARTPFTVTLARDDRSLLLTVRDGSPAPPVEVVAGGNDTGGRGLWIVDAVSHSWGVATVDGVAKSVWARFDLG